MGKSDSQKIQSAASTTGPDASASAASAGTEPAVRSVVTPDGSARGSEAANTSASLMLNLALPDDDFDCETEAAHDHPPIDLTCMKGAPGDAKKPHHASAASVKDEDLPVVPDVPGISAGAKRAARLALCKGMVGGMCKLCCCEPKAGKHPYGKICRRKVEACQQMARSQDAARSDGTTPNMD